jgi:hypothetical protein
LEDFLDKLYEVIKNDNWRKDKKVMYYLWYEYYNGAISPIYNADGSVMVYEGE